MSRSWRDYIPTGKTYPNLRLAASKPYRGITAFVGGEPWLVLDFDGKSHLLENQKGECVRISTPLRWLPSTRQSSLIAASRLEESPFKKGAIVDEQQVGNLKYSDREWEVEHGNAVLPLEAYVMALEARKWQPLSHEVGEREDEKNEPLSCPKCSSHTVELHNKELHEFRCLTCGSMFEHEVHFNPHNSGKVGYEVDRGKDWKPYAPGPDDPKKRPTCSYCGYSWKSHHQFTLSKCPNCGNSHAQEDVMALEGQSPPTKKKAGIHFDQNGQELVPGKPYLLKSPHYKIPDVVYIVKADSSQVEAAIESSKGHFPIKIDQKKHQKMNYSYEPFSKHAEALPNYPQSNGMECPYCGTPMDFTQADEDGQVRCPGCGMDHDVPELNLYNQWQDEGTQDWPQFRDQNYASRIGMLPGQQDPMLINTDPNHGGLVCPYCHAAGLPAIFPDEQSASQHMMEVHPEGMNQNPQMPQAKTAWDYTQTTDSMGGRDTGAPIRSDLQAYDEDIPNPSETAATPESVPPLTHDHLGEGGPLFTPRGTVHTLENTLTGSQILVMSNGEGGVMGWTTGGQATAGANWSTTDLLKLQDAINGGMYAEMPAAGGPGPMNQAPQPQAPVAKVARKTYSPSEQEALIAENPHGEARNIAKMDLNGTHYIHDDSDILFLW